MKTVLKFALTAMFIGIGLIVFAQTSSDEAKDALDFFGLSGFWSGVIIMTVTIVGKLIPLKAADWLYHIEKFLHFLNEKTNRESKTEKIEKTKANELLKKNKIKARVLMSIAVLFICGYGFAQSSFQGFFKPINLQNEIVTLKSEGSQAEVNKDRWLFRPSAAISALAIDLKEKDPISKSLTAVGIGLSYGKYQLIEDNIYCTYSFNLFGLTSIEIGGETKTNIGIAGTVDVFNKFIGVGVGYVDKRVLLLNTISYSF